MFSDWGAFRDASVPRCYAIADGRTPSRLSARFRTLCASIGNMARTAELRGTGPLPPLATNCRRRQPRSRSRIGRQELHALAGGGGRCLGARTARMDAAILAAMRSATRHDDPRHRHSRAAASRTAYSLAGAATAMDAATLACSRAAEPRRFGVPIAADSDYMRRSHGRYEPDEHSRAGGPGSRRA